MVKATYRTIQDYVQGCDEEYRARIQDILSICRELVPDAEEKISWGLPTFLYHGYLVQVGQCKGYIGFRRSLLPINVLKRQFICRYMKNCRLL